MTDFNQLKGMSREQLLKLAGKQGLKVHWKAKPETIIKQIMDHTLVPQKPQVAEDKAKPAKKEYRNTREDIEAFLQKNKARQPNLMWKFNDDDSFTVSCKGAEDCFNMHQPFTVIQRHLDLHVMRGALRPMGHSREHFESGVATGKSAYTNVVLAG